MKFCNYCGAPVLSSVKFCTECGSPIPETGMSSSVISQKGLIPPQPYRPIVRRPTGITLIAIVICIRIFMNSQSIVGDITSGRLTSSALSSILGLYTLILVVIQVIVVFGLFKMKSWGRKATILMCLVSILGAAVMAFFIPNLIIDMTWQSIDANLSPIEQAMIGDMYTEYETLFRMGLILTFIIETIIGVIIIGYLKSKKRIFLY